MILQWFIVVTFWLSYLAITFASVITIADFVQSVQERRTKKRVK
jgi:hypothetical protein